MTTEAADREPGKIGTMRRTIRECLRRSLARFAAFDAFALALGVCLVWNEHFGSGREAPHLPEAATAGAASAMLASAAVRIALERAKARGRTLRLAPWVCGAAAFAAGLTLFLGASGGVYTTLCSAVLGGLLLATGFAGLASLYGGRNAPTLSMRLATGAGIAGIAAFIAMAGSLLCLSAVERLVMPKGMNFSLFYDVFLLSWWVVFPVLAVANLPEDDEPACEPMWLDVLLGIAASLGAALLVVLYVYIAKIAVNGEMPSGEMNWYASFALAGYVAFWLLLRGSKIKVLAFAARWGWIALIPVVAAQIAGIAIRYNAYGLTAPRMAGMASLAAGLFALAAAAFDRKPKCIFVFAAAVSLIVSVSPFNVFDVPLHQQSARLRAALERSGCLGADGRLSIPVKPQISDEDAKAICGAWRYLFGGGSVWTRPEFFETLKADVAAKHPGKTLPDVLGIDAEGEPGRDSADVKYIDLFREAAGIPIQEYTVLGRRTHRWRTIETDPAGGGRREISCGGRKFDITAHIDRILEYAGPVRNWNGGEKRLPENLAFIELPGGCALAIDAIRFWSNCDGDKRRVDCLDGTWLFKDKAACDAACGGTACKDENK